MTYTWALIRRIITKDPLVGKMAVAKALHEKVCWPSTFVFDSVSHISPIEDATSPCVLVDVYIDETKRDVRGS
jgi:hypothetical protein